MTFAPLAQILLHELGEHENAPQGEILERLHALAAACCPADHVDETTTRLALALGIGEEGDGRSEERRYRVAEIRAGLLAMLEGLSRQGPIVLVFEDAHLAQPSMLDPLVRTCRRCVLPTATGGSAVRFSSVYWPPDIR